MTIPERVDGSNLSKEDFEELRSKISGQVIVKGEAPDDVYRPLLERWNRMHIKEANIIVLPESEEEVSETIKFVAKHSLDVAICSGGHTYSGPSSGYGLIIDMRKMRKVSVDVDKKIAVAQGGCIAADVEGACEAHGLRPVMGAINATGCGGITTGGGIGLLSGQLGLVCDNLLAARVALADGRILVASETENEDLFWGIRGAGSNFGIVTEFTYKVYERKPEVYFGFMLYGPDKIDAALGMMNSLYLDCVCQSEGKLMIAGFFSYMGGALMPGFMIYYDGTEEEALPFIKPLLDLGPAHSTATMKRHTEATDFAQFKGMFPPGFDRLVGTSTQISYPVADEILHDAVERFKAVVQSNPEHLNQSKLLFDLRDYRKIESVPVEAMAYANRRSGLLISADVIWDEPEMDKEMFQVARVLIDGLRSNIKKVNNSKGIADVGAHAGATTLYALLSDGEEKLTSVFGPNLPKLKVLKGKYDPDMMWNKWYPVPPELPN